MTPIQPWELPDLSLLELLKLGKAVPKESTTRSVRLAILGDAATQHYRQAMEAVLKLRGYWPEVYEAEFDTIRQEAATPDGSLYRHTPDFVILFTCTQALESRFAATADKTAFAEEICEELVSTWNLIAANSRAVILQHNFVVPLSRPFGNQSRSNNESLFAQVSRLNGILSDVAPTHNVRIVDTEFQAAYFGKRYWLDDRLWCQARQALSPKHLPALAKSVSDTLLADLGQFVKCVVVDLDNTLWGGILGDDGPEGIEIGQGEVGLVFLRFQRMLKELAQRGILLAVCSKNVLEDVRSVLESHPDLLLRAADFAAITANHHDKASNLLDLVSLLNISPDSVVFLDDSEFERDLVRSAHPSIQVPRLDDDPGEWLGTLSRYGLFEGRKSTEEDKLRAVYYQAEGQRREQRSQYANLGDYLRDLSMAAEVQPFEKANLSRVSQLVQRSNQFNLTTIRYTDRQLENLALSPDHRTLVVRLKDRFGDNGVISVVVLAIAERTATIESWVMSCRVLGRTVEAFILNQIVERSRDAGCCSLIGKYISTRKNGLVAKLYPSLGFSQHVANGDERLFCLSLDQFRGLPCYIRRTENDADFG